ncbi:MAG: chromate transporter [Erysipelotrichaceae bacterium]|nr:chromate transporter [Erysipelotrichaceae bacterium]
MKYLELFISFFKIGITTFGGGYAMLPIIEREIIEKRKWSTKEEILDYYAVSQCTPGVIAVNVATFIGYNIAGVLGGIVATLSVVCPSVIIISIIAAFLKNFASIPMVISAVKGLSAGVCAIVISAVYAMGKKVVKDYISVILLLFGFIFAYFTDLSIVIAVVIAAVAGIVLSKVKAK